MTALRFSPIFAAPAAVLPDDDRPDADLLARFRATRDEVAFAALVARHTPGVRAVCRSWLRSAADVDDATQATFLVLVQRLDGIRRPAALAAWLYRVAENVARRLKQQAARTGPLTIDVPAVELVVSDHADVLAEEVDRLPEKYRRPIQLCYAGGLTTAEAARRLGVPTGTLVTQLARGRDKLRAKLAARGVTLAAVLTATGNAARSVPPAWVWATAHAAVAVFAGESPTALGVSERTLSLSQGVARAMLWKNLKLIAAAAMIATGLVGFAIGQWATADGPKKIDPPAAAKPAAKADDARPDAPARRREAVIRMPAGGFVKDVDVAPYGSGRVTWTYDDDKVAGLIEGNVMGVEFEIETEAEVSLSSSGTIYGVVTSAKVTHLKANGELGAELGEYAKFLPLVEPLINEMVTDLPFSYQFRVKGDRLTILNFRALMAGPNPLTKLGPLLDGDDLGGLVEFALYFQAFSTAMEGTYTSAEAAEKAPKKRPPFRKPAAKVMSSVQIDEPSEDVRRLGPNWRRGPIGVPNHLTPDRVHGSIE